MIWLHIFRKTLRETARRPLYLATLLGIPMAFMVIFGAALPMAADEAPAEGDAEGEAAAAAARSDPGSIPVLRADPVPRHEPARYTSIDDRPTETTIVDVTPDWVDDDDTPWWWPSGSQERGPQSWWTDARGDP